MILKGAGDLKRVYGYEYIGDHFDCFICPETEKGLVTLYRSIQTGPREWSAIGIFKQSEEGGSEIVIQHLANLCGEPLVKTNSQESQQYRYLFLFLSIRKPYLEI